MQSMYAQLNDRFAAAFSTVTGKPDTDPVLRRSQHAHFQADAALGLAKSMKMPPRAVAEKVVDALEVTDLAATVEISGPGFINVTLRPEALSLVMSLMRASERLGVPVVEKAQRIVVDYSSPNVAKEMHVGHLRSNIIGDAAVRVLSHMGHDVVKINHLGDWGTQFGMLIEHLIDEGVAADAGAASVRDLTAFYQASRAKFDADEAFATRSRERIVKLQGGDEQSLALWRMLVKASQDYFDVVYAKLGVLLRPEDSKGESFYNEMIPATIAELDALGLLVESDGAKVVFPTGFVGRDDAPLPLIVQKSDGGYGYATTDLTSIRYRIRDLAADRLLYVVGVPQSQHFAMLFQAAKDAGWLTQSVAAEHVAFGHMQGKDGKTFKTRSGDSVKLVDLIDSAVDRATSLVEQKNPEMPAQEREQVGRAVGVGAVKYTDLSSVRTKDYIFDLARMVSYDGNTAPYLQYAHARICSMLAKADETVDAEYEIALTEPAEVALALQLDGFANVVVAASETIELHTLCEFLYDTASAFTTFYEQCPVLSSEGAQRASRIALSALTARVLRTGLGLLGIDTPTRM